MLIKSQIKQRITFPQIIVYKKIFQLHECVLGHLEVFQEIFIESSLCARHCPRYLEYNGAGKHLWSHGAYRLVGGGVGRR